VTGASPNRGEQPFDAPFDHVRSPLSSDLLPVRWTLDDLLRPVDEAAKHDRVEAPEPENTREPRFAEIRCAVYCRVLVGAHLMTDGVDTIGREDTLDIELINGRCAAARGVIERWGLNCHQTSGGVIVDVYYLHTGEPDDDRAGVRRAVSEVERRMRAALRRRRRPVTTARESRHREKRAGKCDGAHGAFSETEG